MGGLPLTVVNHGPALSRYDGERLGVAVARLGHAVHEGTVAPSCATYPALWGSLASLFRGGPVAWSDRDSEAIWFGPDSIGLDLDLVIGDSMRGIEGLSPLDHSTMGVGAALLFQNDDPVLVSWIKRHRRQAYSGALHQSRRNVTPRPTSTGANSPPPVARLLDGTGDESYAVVDGC
jgi:hypothetical protein